MGQRQTLPVLPLRGTVMFPGITAPIAAGRPGTLRAIETALKGERLVFAVAQRDNTEEPTPEILFNTGVIARIGQVQRGLGGVQLLLQGEQRATALQYSDQDGHLAAVIVPSEEMLPLDAKDPAFEALHKEARERAAELGEKRGLPEEVVHQVLDSVEDAGRFADLVAGYIELTVPEKQGLLETLSVEERLRRVLVHVQRQIGLLEAQEDIKTQVQEELGERQREMFLREQMKQIRRELGEEDECWDLVSELAQRFIQQMQDRGEIKGEWEATLTVLTMVPEQRAREEERQRTKDSAVLERLTRMEELLSVTLEILRMIVLDTGLEGHARVCITQCVTGAASTACQSVLAPLVRGLDVLKHIAAVREGHRRVGERDVAMRDAMASTLKLLEAYESKLTQLVPLPPDQTFLSDQLAAEIATAVSMYDSLCEVMESSLTGGEGSGT